MSKKQLLIHSASTILFLSLAIPAYSAEPANMQPNGTHAQRAMSHDMHKDMERRKEERMKMREDMQNGNYKAAEEERQKMRQENRDIRHDREQMHHDGMGPGTPPPAGNMTPPAPGGTPPTPPAQ